MTGLWTDLWINAPPETIALGALALVIGLSSLVFSVAFSLSFVVRGRALETASVPIHADQRGPFAVALAAFAQPGRIATSLGPDAAMDYLRGRLDAQLASRQSFIRFLAYAPLLVGLLGTLVGLSRVLQEAAQRPVRSTAAASVAVPIQRHVNADQEYEDFATRIQASLKGVFFGTAAGVAGSFLGSLGALLLAVAGQSGIRRAEEYIERVVLPMIPERRIPIRLEDAEETILRALEERVGGMVTLLRDQLRGIAVSLVDSASSAANASKLASESFTVAAKAVKEAGNLEAAAKRIADGLKNIQAATDDLSDAAVAARDASASHAESMKVFQQATHEVGVLGTAAQDGARQLTTAVLRNESQMQEMFASVTEVLTKLDGRVEAVSSSFDNLATNVEARNRLESQAIDDARKSQEGFARGVVATTEAAQGLTQELIALGKRVEDFGPEVGRAIDRDLQESVSHLAAKLTATLEALELPLRTEASNIRAAGDHLVQQVAKAKLDLPEIHEGLKAMSDALMQHSQRITDLLLRLDQQHAVAAPRPVQTAPDVSSISEVLNRIQPDVRQVAEATRQLLSAARQSASSPRGGGWWSRLTKR